MKLLQESDETQPTSKKVGPPVPNKPSNITTLSDKSKQDLLEVRHLELLMRQKQLQEQYQRLQQMQQNKSAANIVAKNQNLLSNSDTIDTGKDESGIQYWRKHKLILNNPKQTSQTLIRILKMKLLSTQSLPLLMRILLQRFRPLKFRLIRMRVKRIPLLKTFRSLMPASRTSRTATTTTHPHSLSQL